MVFAAWGPRCRETDEGAVGTSEDGTRDGGRLGETVVADEAVVDEDDMDSMQLEACSLVFHMLLTVVPHQVFHKQRRRACR